MSREVVVHCEAPGCDSWSRSAATPPLAGGWLVVLSKDAPPLDLCGWECALRLAAAFPPPEVIPA